MNHQTSQHAPWLRYMGLPYRWNGDPDRHGGTDCLRLIIAVLSLYDAPRPEVKPQWYATAEGRGWRLLVKELAAITTPVEGGQPLDVALLKGGHPIAMGICVAGGLLTTCQGQGVHWRPLVACKVHRWFRFLPSDRASTLPELIS